MRIPPAGFVAELQRRFGPEWGVKWSELLSRWVVFGPTADGRIVDQTWGWYRKWNAETKAYEPVDPEPTGLPPFRELDLEAQGEIIANMERSYVFNRAEGDTTLKQRFARIGAENDAKKAASRVRRGELYRLLLNEVNIKRPGWKKEHQRAQGAVLVSGAAGVFRPRSSSHS
jgi:hypothetical protein